MKKLLILALLSLCQLRIEAKALRTLLEQSKEVDAFCTYPEYQAALIDLSNQKLDNIDGISKLTINGINIGDIKKLAINLSGNKLVEIPTELFLLKNLTYLNLSKNLLAELPAAILNLKKLEYLNLFGNKLQGLPNSIIKLKNLKHLNLLNNKLENFPESIDKLKNLEYLNLANNLLTLVPIKIAKLSNLKYLNLDNNKFIATAHSYEILGYENNKLKYGLRDFIDYVLPED